MKPPRVGIVGARRRRQGLGPFVARDLLAAGADVPCFVVTSEASREAAHRALRETCGLEARGYLDLDAMLASEALDALAILSPAQCHAEHLEAAQRAGVHVLCEKPFVWDVPDLAGRARALADAIEAQGRVLWENCQWPYTLPAFEALHPGALDAPPRRFEMELQPASLGLRSLADSIPHPLSLLQALVPGDEPRVEDVCFATRDPASPSQAVRFRYCSEGHRVEVEVRLEQTQQQPRRAGYALDGRWAQRLVSREDYRLSFADANRSVPVPDPLALLIADFVAALGDTPSRGRRTRGREISRRMQLLGDIAGAYEHGGVE
ncbi:MAG TPA: Gfo/Idh/MocA family oxidoreductase [Myxococcota bacterium]